MQLLHIDPFLIIMMFVLLCTSSVAEPATVSKKIIVDNGGQGDFTSVQKAIDSIPSNNSLWTLVHIKAATYKEKVTIPRDKPFVILQGEGMESTIIQWNEAGSSTESSTFILKPDNFMALDLMFMNTYNLPVSKGSDEGSIQWAPAATLYGDKASFYRCGFVGVQDTLTDMLGRHYFQSCYIEGAVDFIWGVAQSFYETSTINATTGILNGASGFITAQGRENANDTSGFVFVDCNISATGPVYLGRAYRDYSRVIFTRTYMPDAIVPKGWDPWKGAGHEATITFSELDCRGPGSSKTKRVKWEKNLSGNELSRLTNADSFINQEGWIQQQPDIP